MYFNTPTLAAPSYFDSRTVRASPSPWLLPKSANQRRFRLSPAEAEEYGSLDKLLERNDTRAFLVIKDDSIVYERYFADVDEATELPAFSLSKTFAAALVGCALKDGLIRSMQDSVVRYVPELSSKSRYSEVTLDQLLRMTSGIDFSEESLAGAELYYSTDLRSHMYAYDVRRTPGRHYLYGSVNIQLAWDVLHRSLRGKTVAQYFEERFWGPLGAERPASWSLDSQSNGVEKFFGGFNATARDHARLGLLFLHQGTLNGQLILSPEWVEQSVSPDPIAGRVRTADGEVLRGKYQWFVTLDGRAYFAKGYHGQYVFVVPGRNAVFVRFGEGYGDVDWPSLFVRLADNL